MNQPESPDRSKTRLKAKVKEYPKLSKSKALLLPYRNEIKALRARNAAYDDIRLILEQENVVVSLNTLYRFCRDVLEEKTATVVKQRLPKSPAVGDPPPPTIQPVSAAAPSIQAALQERRERMPGLWGRRKRGPRIADSQNL
jgi:hypothetical protein